MLRWILDLTYWLNISLNVFTPSNCTYQKLSQCWTRPDQCHFCLYICAREEPNCLQGEKTPRFVIQISGSHYPLYAALIMIRASVVQKVDKAIHRR